MADKETLVYKAALKKAQEENNRLRMLVAEYERRLGIRPQGARDGRH